MTETTSTTPSTKCIVGYKVQFEIVDSSCSSCNFQSSFFIRPSTPSNNKIAQALVFEMDFKWSSYKGNSVKLTVKSAPDAPTKPNLKDLLPIGKDANIVEHKLYETNLAEEILKFYAFCLFEKGFVFVNRIEDTHDPSDPNSRLDQYIYKDEKHYLPPQFWKDNLKFEFTSERSQVERVENPFLKDTKKKVKTRYMNETPTASPASNISALNPEQKREYFNKFCDDTQVSKAMMNAVLADKATGKQFTTCFLQFVLAPEIAKDPNFKKKVSSLFNKCSKSSSKNSSKVSKVKGGVRKGRK